MRTLTNRVSIALVLTALGVGLICGGCPNNAGTTDGTVKIPDAPPNFATAKFSDPTTIDNPYFPLVPGSISTFEGTTVDGTERVVIEVLDETRVVAGVTARVVLDRAFIDDVIVEETLDWYAQDDDGNVWYLGEAVDNYELDGSGNPVITNHNGSWETGQDIAGVGVVAQPGIIMPGSPTVGDPYFQEFYAGNAEDVGQVLALSAELTLRDGTKHTCLRTLDSTALDTSMKEYKYYAAGIGLVAEDDGSSSELVELVQSVP